MSANKKTSVYTRHKQTTKKAQNVCGIRGRGTVLLLAGSALEKCPGLSQISKACVPELLLNTCKVESTVCNCVCVLLCGAPVDLLLLFLPPGPKADRLSKHSLPQQWTDSLLDTCILGTEFFFFVVESIIECLKMLLLFFFYKGVAENMTGSWKW